MNFESEEANLCTSVTAKVIEGKVRNAFFFFFCWGKPDLLVDCVNISSVMVSCKKSFFLYLNIFNAVLCGDCIDCAMLVWQ